MNTFTLMAGVFGFALLTAGLPVSTPIVPDPTPVDPAVLTVRESAWRAYFAGDTQTLGTLLPPEFIGISMDDEPFADRTTTLDGAREFRAGGGRLVSLAFPETRAQRFGDVVVLYGRYEAAIESGGAVRMMRGRLTEVFVRRDGKWVHPGWHLDATPAPAPAP
jgi:hypothetical protein